MSEDKIIEKLLEHDEKLSNMVTNDEFQKFRNEMLQGQDTMVGILKRLDEERVFTHKWVKEIEYKVEENTRELQKLKLQLHIA